MPRWFCIFAAAVSVVICLLIVFFWVSGYIVEGSSPLAAGSFGAFGKQIGWFSRSGIFQLTIVSVGRMPLFMAAPDSYALALMSTSAFIFWRLPRWQEIRRKRRLAAAGLCQFCGYDLRASTSRCPECGNEVLVANPNSGGFSFSHKLQLVVFALAGILFGCIVLFDLAPDAPSPPIAMECFFLGLLAVFLLGLLGLVVWIARAARGAGRLIYRR